MSKNKKIIIDKTWINEEEFGAFLRSIKNAHKPDDAPFDEFFCMKFADGSDWNIKLHFATKDGFWFDDWDID